MARGTRDERRDEGIRPAQRLRRLLSPCAALALLVLVSPLGASHQDAAAPAGSIQPSPDHPSYWEFRGHTQVLLGGSDDDNLFQWLDEPLREQLDRLKAAGGNYLRNTMSDRRDRGFEVYPFRRLDDGRYDLAAWNPEYWRRFDRFLQWTAARDIVVQIEVWDRFDYSRDHWTPHPYNPANNVNYSYEASGFQPEYPNHPGRNEQPFFYTTPVQRDNQVVFKYQRRFVERMLESTLRHGHVLYCIDNETSGDPAWSAFWAGVIRQAAQARGRRVFVTEMWDDWDITADRHRQTLDRPDRYDFADLSQNNHNSGAEHWRNAVWARRYLRTAPRPINAVKTYGADGNRFRHTDQDGVERFVRHLLAGFAAVRFHRPDSGLGLNPKAEAAIRAARRLVTLAPPWGFEPIERPLDAGGDRLAYAARGQGGDARLLVYFPSGGRVQTDLPAGRYDVTWIHADAGPAEPSASGPLAADANGLTLSAPGAGNVLAVVAPASAKQ